MNPETTTPDVQQLTTVTPISPRQLRVKPNKFKWSLGLPTFEAVVSEPITSSTNDGLTFTAVAVLSRSDPGFEGHTYYLEEEHTPHGWDTQDCEMVTVTPMPEPHIPPTGALPVPVITQDYILDVEVPAYLHKTSVEPATTLQPGNYLSFQESGDRLQVAVDRNALRYWINPADNFVPAPEPEKPTSYIGPREASTPEPEPTPVVEEPTPEPVEVDWKLSYEPFYPPKEYVANIDGRIWNLDEHGPEIDVLLHKGTHVYVYGTVERDNQKWYRMKLTRDTKFELWACVPLEFSGRAVLVLPGPSFLDKVLHRWEATKQKSIFTDSPLKFIDIAKNPYKEKK